jgi:D-tyrosyl-tRNA(Tyr) deacylase
MISLAGDEADGEPHVFVSLHVSVKVEILDVNSHKAGIGGVHYAKKQMKVLMNNNCEL